MSLKRLAARLELQGIKSSVQDGKIVVGGGKPPWLDGKDDKKDDKGKKKGKKAPPWADDVVTKKGKKGKDKGGKKSSKPPWLMDKDDDKPKKKAKASVVTGQDRRVDERSKFAKKNQWEKRKGGRRAVGAFNAQDGGDDSTTSKREPNSKKSKRETEVEKPEGKGAYSKLIALAMAMQDDGIIVVEIANGHIALAAHAPHPYYYPAGISDKGWKQCWMPMFEKYGAQIQRGGWGAAVNIYKAKCKKVNIEPYGSPKAPPVGKGAGKAAAGVARAGKKVTAARMPLPVNPDVWFQSAHKLIDELIVHLNRPLMKIVHKVHLTPAVQGMVRKIVVDLHGVTRELKTASHVLNKSYD